jgi:hypothetical protein
MRFGIDGVEDHHELHPVQHEQCLKAGGFGLVDIDRLHVPLKRGVHGRPEVGCGVCGPSSSIDVLGLVAGHAGLRNLKSRRGK